ncbi:myelin protein zero-like protein 2 [Danio aesculapii]|uniref:myelin protein zero-like protein 2 n=1 Tax=Danio aesculapii TaxID=1142201 RepID=UPI0024BFFCDC|nr:myelin protein zero-like protein 2 [Danio aesculapii]
MRVQQAVLLLLLLLAASGCSIRVFTSGDVKAVNGTDVRLKCSFQSSAAVKETTLTVSWSFRPLTHGHQETVFYYHQKPYPPPEGRFRSRVQWVGDVSRGDASLVLRRVPFSYNGTFSCQIRNPPDVHGNIGEVRLSVVTTASLSEMLILCLSIGGAVLLLLLLSGATAVCVRSGCRRRSAEHTHSHTLAAEQQLWRQEK